MLNTVYREILCLFSFHSICCNGQWAYIQNMSSLELWVISFKMVLPAGHNFTKIFSLCNNVSRYLLIAAKYVVGNFHLFLDTKIWRKKLLKVSSFKLQMLWTNLCLYKEEKNNPCILYTCTNDAIKTTLCM